MQLTSSTTLRTYRYLRIALIVAALAIAITVVQVLVGLGSVSSISALYYTPGRGVFIGALFAVSLALIALSGHSWEQVLLDLAALFVPMMAIVPTPVETGDVPGFDPGCTGVCVPPADALGTRFGMTTLVIIAVLGIVIAVVLGLLQRTLGGGEAFALAVAAVIVAGVEWWALAAPTGFLRHGHVFAAVCFFTLLGLTAIVAAAAARGGWRVAYAIIAALIALDLVWLAFAPVKLWGETVALLLFAVFWMLQTVERWNEADPGIVSRSRR